MTEPDGAVRAIARGALALGSCALAVAGVLVATEGTTFPAGAAPTLALAPAAAVVDCPAVGPYRPPERGSVGVPTGLSLCSASALTITEAGAVLDGWEVRGGIVVAAPDVVVRRSRIVGDGSLPFGIRTTGAGSVRIEDVTVTGDFPEAAIGGDRWSAERIEISGVTGDGARLGEFARLRNSTVHEFVTPPGRVASALVVHGTGRGVLVEYNRIELGSGPGRGSAVLLAPREPAERADDADAADDADGAVVIRGNVLGGGRYTVRQDRASVDVQITGNEFLRGAEQAPLRVSRSAVLEDNRYLDGGPLPEG